MKKTRPFGDLSDTKTKKKSGMDAHKFNSKISQKSRRNTEEDSPRSLSFTKRIRAHPRGRERLESEIGGVFVVFVGGGDLRNFFLEAFFVT